MCFAKWSNNWGKWICLTEVNCLNSRVSYVEIYNEQLYDLLSTGGPQSKRETQLSIGDSKSHVWVKGLSIPLVQSLDEALNYLFEVSWTAQFLSVFLSLSPSHWKFAQLIT